MPFRAVRRAATLATALALTVTGLALADTTPADANPDVIGVQGSRYLGEVAPGARTTVAIGFTLRCANGWHAERGSSITLGLESETVPLDGSVALVTAGSIGPVPADWPLEGEPCPGGTGDPSLDAAVPATVELTAPTVVGTGYEYVLLFSRTPDTGLTGIAAVTLTLDVVEPEPPDTTPPSLVNVPADISVVTSDPAGATVTWTDPTATDDTDPAPTVACAPASGSAFAVGTTTVVCTATDSSGNDASASFAVSVSLASPSLATATWGAPLGSGTLVANHGRVVPVKVELRLDGLTVTPAAGLDVRLVAERLDACGGDVLGPERTLALTWDGGRWTSRLDTTSMAPGCWRLTASAADTTFGSTEILVSGSAAGKLRADLRGGR